MVSWLDRLRAALAPGIVVERALASGGMGHVALGQDVVLDRPVAIKVLKPELVTAVTAERFLARGEAVPLGFTTPTWSGCTGAVKRTVFSSTSWIT